MFNYNNKINKVFIHQPDFAPWVTFFKRIAYSDFFVILDDVQFNRRGWTHRDYIKVNLKKELITIPTLKNKRDETMIKDVLIDYSNKRWIDKIINSVYQNYNSTKNFEIFYDFLSKTLKRKHEKLISLNLSIIDYVIKKLNIKVEKIFSSQLNINSKKSEKILAICNKLDCSHYITGSGSENYLKINDFNDQNIKILNNIIFQKEYSQKGNFIKDLSIIDIMFCVDFEEIESLIKNDL